MSSLIYRRRRGQTGLAAVEFALIAAAILFPLLIGIMEFGRIIFYWNAATEATRLGARLAVVCDLDDSIIKSKMIALFPLIQTSEIKITYEPTGCTTTTCHQVRVEIVRPGPEHTVLRDFRTSSPTAFRFLPTFPPFGTTLPRESMRSSFNGVINPVCQSNP